MDFSKTPKKNYTSFEEFKYKRKKLNFFSFLVNFFALPVFPISENEFFSKTVSAGLCRSQIPTLRECNSFFSKNNKDALVHLSLNGKLHTSESALQLCNFIAFVPCVRIMINRETKKMPKVRNQLTSLNCQWCWKSWKSETRSQNVQRNFQAKQPTIEAMLLPLEALKKQFYSSVLNMFNFLLNLSARSNKPEATGKNTAASGVEILPQSAVIFPILAIFPPTRWLTF